MQAFIPLQETADVELLARGPFPPGLPPVSCPGLSLSWEGALSAPPKVVILNTPFSINRSQHDDIASPSLVSVNSPLLIFNNPCTLLVAESYPKYFLVCKASPFEVTLKYPPLIIKLSLPWIPLFNDVTQIVGLSLIFKSSLLMIPWLKLPLNYNAPLQSIVKSSLENQ